MKAMDRSLSATRWDINQKRYLLLLLLLKLQRVEKRSSKKNSFKMSLECGDVRHLLNMIWNNNKRQVSGVFSTRECQFCYQPIPSTGCSNRKHLFTISSVLLFVWLGCNYRMITKIKGMNVRGRHQHVSFFNKRKYFDRHKPESANSYSPKGNI